MTLDVLRLCCVDAYSRPTAWVEAHKAKTPGNRVLQQQLDEWMEQWETQEKERQDTAAADAVDDGWTVVTKQRVCSSMTYMSPASMICIKKHSLS